MAKMKRKPISTRKPPVPADDSTDVDDWTSRVMPDLQPIVASLDQQIPQGDPDLQYAVKWKKAYYGREDLGWVIEMVAYDISVNMVFLGGADFDSPPPLGDTDRSRYIKIKSLEEAETPEMGAWIEQTRPRPGLEVARGFVGSPMPFTRINLKQDVDNFGPNFDGSPDLDFRPPRRSRSNSSIHSWVISVFRRDTDFPSATPTTARKGLRGRRRQQQDGFDDEIIELGKWDAVRVPPHLARL